MRRRAWAVAMVAVTVGLGAWMMRKGEPDADASRPDVVAEIKRTEASAMPVANAPQLSLPVLDDTIIALQVFAGPPREDDDRGPLLGETIDALLAGAAAGELEAMRELGTGLHRCLQAFVDPRATEIERRFLEESASEYRAEVGFLNYTIQMAHHLDCIAIGHERAATGLGWLERAARAGDVSAKVAFATRAFDEAAYPDDSAMLSDLDEVLRRRGLVDAWVRDGIESGERSALANIANSPAATVRDPRMRAIYELAWKMVLAREHTDGPWADQLRRQQSSEYRDMLGQAWTDEPGAWDAHIAEARRIAARTSQ